MAGRCPAGNRSAIGLGSLSRYDCLPPTAWPALRTTLRKNSIRPVTNSSVKSRAASMTFLRRDSSVVDDRCLPVKDFRDFHRDISP